MEIVLVFETIGETSLKEGIFYLTTHSTHFIYGYMAWETSLIYTVELNYSFKQKA